eukprot:TRINITY_DN82199_c0_g1_i1.p1 TRINITY_DN82199_c0_g1~~TRINITY_DN82199_c0_g1_i1.p1  ORF type:complete len:1170 (+),score=357.51 TRINITY_DN82199_c0_g1_i1:125-3634(+)
MGFKDLQDLVKGIRAHKQDEISFVQSALSEIHDEIKTTDVSRKAACVQKLAYLHMMGYDMSWASFHVLEVMSSTRFVYKRVGYLAAAVSFRENSDVLLLSTNLFKKDLNSSSPFDVIVALTCLSNVISTDLARDLVSDIMGLLNNSRAIVRKKAALILYKVFLKFPDALRPSFPRLREKLDDPDTCVVAAAVNVITELSRKNPKNYLVLVPTFFQLLTSTQSNWTLIKIVKFFGALTPLEPRLGKKLVEPLTHLISTTQAKGLAFECINTVVGGMMEHVGLVKLCVEHLRDFLGHEDQNLKYLGLRGLSKVMEVYPKMIVGMKDTIIACLEDPDITIRRRAVDLVCGVVTKKNITGIVRKLIKYVQESDDASYREHIVQRIIETCSKDNYKRVMDFEWYLEILVELAEVKGLMCGEKIGKEMFEVCVRVPSVREEAVELMLDTLKAPHLADGNLSDPTLFEVLNASAWVVGEYLHTVQGELADHIHDAIECLTPSRLSNFPSNVQAVYVQAALKVFALAVKEGVELQAVKDKFTKAYKPLESSVHIDVQERVIVFFRLVELQGEFEDTNVGLLLCRVFEEELNPISEKAQGKVKPPDGMDLDDPFDFDGADDDWSSEEESDDSDVDDQYFFLGRAGGDVVSGKPELGSTAEGDASSDLFYLRGATATGAPLANIDDIPTVKLTDNDLGLSRKERRALRQKEEKKRKGKHSERRRHKKHGHSKPVVVRAVESFEDSDGEPQVPHTGDATTDRLDVDLSAPLREDEALPTIEAYKTKTAEDVRLEMAKKQEVREMRRKERKEQKKEEEESERRRQEKRTKRKHGKKEEDEESKSRHRRHRRHHHRAEQGQEEKKEEPPKENAKAKAKKESKEEVSKDSKQSKGDDDLFDFLNTPETTQQSSAPVSGSTSTAPPDSSARASASTPTSSATRSFPFVISDLANDDYLQVSYNTQIQSTDGKTLTIPFLLNRIRGEDGLPGVHGPTITNIRMMLIDTKAISVLRASPDVLVQAPFVIRPGDTGGKLSMQVRFKTMRAHRLQGYVLYQADSVEKRLDFEMVIPTWIFFSPVQITKENFDVLLESGSLFLSKGRVELTHGRVIAQGLREVGGLLRAQPVDSTEMAVRMYAQSVKGHHLCVVVQAATEQVLVVNLYTSDERIGATLMNEVDAYFSTF